MGEVITDWKHGESENDFQKLTSLFRYILMNVSLMYILKTRFYNYLVALARTFFVTPEGKRKLDEGEGTKKRTRSYNLILNLYYSGNSAIPC